MALAYTCTVAYDDRKKHLAEIEKLRRGRTVVCFFNFDRVSTPAIPGLSTQFHAEVKEAVFRVLKDSKPSRGVDLCLYTRGGDINSVWPIVSLIREFDPNFEVIVPFRCHSSGTLLALGAKTVVMGPISELSPIDPSTGNQFNPRDPSDSKSRLAISVEDVRAYRTFVCDQFCNGTSDMKLSLQQTRDILDPYMQKLVSEVHPLALGNVHRVLSQIKQLAKKLLQLHVSRSENIEEVIESLTTKFFSHLHMINRVEAQEILKTRIVFAPKALADRMDGILRAYEDDFELRRTFFLNKFLGQNQESEFRFVGGAVESTVRSYLFETRGTVRQHSKVPPNIQVQLPAGQAMPLIPGLPRETEVEVTGQGWVHNVKPVGVTK